MTVFNVTNHKDYNSYDNSLTHPWTFSVLRDGHVFYPLSEDFNLSFKTEQEATEAEKNYDDTKDVFVVTKNADFTEGRGPMLFHSVHKSYGDAYDYIMKQSGIYGSSQYHHWKFGVNVYGRPYIIDFFNGYNIIGAKFQ